MGQRVFSRWATQRMVRALGEAVCHAGRIMGIDIHGWVEVRPFYQRPDAPDVASRRWDGIIKLDHVLVRDTALFVALVGVVVSPPPTALAARRGVPDDLFAEAEVAYLTDAEHGDLGRLGGTSRSDMG